MKKNKNNIISEEIISEEVVDESSQDEFSDDSVMTPGDYTPGPDKKKLILTVGLIIGLVAVVGVLGFFVFKKYSNNTPTNIVAVEEEPEAPVITEPPTPVITEEPTTEPETEEVETEIETEEFTEEEINEEDSEFGSLDLESEESSLNLEEVVLDEIDESYKDITVYYVDDLKTFHTKTCSLINDKNKIKTTAYSALSNDFVECQDCHPLNKVDLSELTTSELKSLENLNVYKTASNTKYHTENCDILKGTGIEISLRNALENNLEACSLCNPPTVATYKEFLDAASSTDKNKITPTPTKTATVTPTKTNSSGSSNSGTTNKVTATPVPTIINQITIAPIINPVITSLFITGGEVTVDSTLQLYITYAPANAVSTLTYTTSNKNVATINSNGVVTGIKPGTVTIGISAPNGVYASSTVVVKAKENNDSNNNDNSNNNNNNNDDKYIDPTLDINNLGLVGVSKFIYPSNINLIDMEDCSDWNALEYKVSQNGGTLNTTSSSVTLEAGGITRLQLVKYNDNVWSLRVYDSLNSTLNKSILKAMCTKISSMPDTLYSSIYKDYESMEFIGERYRTIGDASVKSELSGGSATYYIKDVNYEY